MARASNLTMCSFCGKSHSEVKKLIAGPGVYICNECVDVCSNILAKELNPPESSGKKGKGKASHKREEIPTPAELLRELDGYLTPTEAGPLQEVARGVIGKMRDNLGARFKLAVSDHRWDDAVAVGGQIMADFPNTRMAQEVRDILPTLRDKAATRAPSRA